MAKRKKLKTRDLVSTIIFTFIIITAFAVVYFLLPYVKRSEDKPANRAELSEIINAPLVGEGDLKVHFISVGQADSIFIEFPTGYNMLIDAGEANTASTVTKYISDLGVSAIDYVLLTHQDSDHAGGMPAVFSTFDVSYAFRPSVYFNPKEGSDLSKYDESILGQFNIGSADKKSVSTTETYYKYLKAVYEENCNWSAFNKDSDFTFVSTLDEVEYRCSVDFLTPTAGVGDIAYTEPNNYSPIFIIRYAGFSLMLTGDAEIEVEQELIDYYSDDYSLDVDLLKVGHHGSKTSSSQAFLELVNPEYSIISCGLNPDKGKKCPWQVTLNALDDVGSLIYRTDLQGNIVLTVHKDGAFNIATQYNATNEQIMQGYSA